MNHNLHVNKTNFHVKVFALGLKSQLLSKKVALNLKGFLCFITARITFISILYPQCIYMIYIICCNAHLISLDLKLLGPFPGSHGP